jgi:rubrerythrin
MRTSQEQQYQSLSRKATEEKYFDLERKYEQIVREANQEVNGTLHLLGLVEKLKQMRREQELEKRRIHELNEQLQDKSRQFQKLQNMYDRMKRKVPMSQKEMEQMSIKQPTFPNQHSQRSPPNHSFRFTKGLESSPHRQPLASPHLNHAIRQPLLPQFGTPTIKKSNRGFQFNFSSEIGSRSGRSSLGRPLF